MILRKALLGDVSKLFALEQKLFTTENYPLSRASLRYHVQNNLLYVAEKDAEIVGYALVLIKRKRAKLYSIGVSVAHRGQKIAQKLLKVVVDETFSRGFEHLLLEVRVDNEAAIALYKEFGFHQTKRMKAFYRDGCDAYLMELDHANKTLCGTF